MVGNSRHTSLPSGASSSTIRLDHAGRASQGRAQPNYGGLLVSPFAVEFPKHRWYHYSPCSRRSGQTSHRGPLTVRPKYWKRSLPQRNCRCLERFAWPPVCLLPSRLSGSSLLRRWPAPRYPDHTHHIRRCLVIGRRGPSRSLEPAHSEWPLWEGCQRVLVCLEVSLTGLHWVAGGPKGFFRLSNTSSRALHGWSTHDPQSGRRGFYRTYQPW